MVSLRRAAAYGVDYLVIAAYALALAAVMILLVPPLDLPKAQAWLLSTATLTAPVVLIFSLLEAGAALSPGKLLMGLRVRRDGARPGLVRALVRNIVKFAPWEIAHAGIWLTPGQPFVDPPGMASLVLMNAAMALVLIQAVLIALFGAGLHDWIAGARVVRR